MRNRFEQLREESWGMPDSPQKLYMLEEAIRIADRYLSENSAYYARLEYTTVAMECGRSEKMFVSFAWCLARFERDPAKFGSHRILWQYKWILNSSWRLPQLSLALVDRMFADFKEKCGQHGYSLRPYYQQLTKYMHALGRLPEAAEAYREWRAAPRDSLADCSACEQNLFGEHHFKIRRYKKGMQALQPILSGKMSCRSVPHNTYSKMIVPLLELGEKEKALETARKAMRLLKPSDYVNEQSNFIEFFAAADMPKAVKLYEQTIRLGLEEKTGWDRLHYLASVRLFLREWSRARRRKKLTESNVVTADWLDGETRRLTEAFDRRNGNGFVSELMARKEADFDRMLAAYR